MDGIEACLWSEHILDEKGVDEHIFPRALALAEITWNRKNYSDFESRLIHVLPVLREMDINFTPQGKWNSSGKKRRREAIDYFVRINSGLDNKSETLEASNPNKEFASSFMNKFFKPADIPSLMFALFRTSKKN